MDTLTLGTRVNSSLGARSALAGSTDPTRQQCLLGLCHSFNSDVRRQLKASTPFLLGVAIGLTASQVFTPRRVATTTVAESSVTSLGWAAIREQTRQMSDQTQLSMNFDRNAGALLTFDAAAVGVTVGLIGKLSLPEPEIVPLALLVVGLVVSAVFCTKCLASYRLEAGPNMDYLYRQFTDAPLAEGQAALLDGLVDAFRTNRRVTIQGKFNDWSWASRSMLAALAMAGVGLLAANAINGGVPEHAWQFASSVAGTLSNWVHSLVHDLLGVR